MSNLTDFFPAGSGGGGLFYSSPKQMPKRWLPYNQIAVKYGATSKETDWGVTFKNTMKS